MTNPNETRARARLRYRYLMAIIDAVQVAWQPGDTTPLRAVVRSEGLTPVNEADWDALTDYVAPDFLTATTRTTLADYDRADIHVDLGYGALPGDLYGLLATLRAMARKEAQASDAYDEYGDYDDPREYREATAYLF